MTEDFNKEEFTEEEIKEKLKEITQEAMRHYDKALRAMDEPEEFNDSFVPFDYE